MEHVAVQVKVICMVVKDFKIDPMLWGGTANIDLSKCHGEIDLMKTQTGDVVMTQTDQERTLQHLLLWLATPLGERFDPKLGCIFYDYLHERLIPSEMAQMERDLMANLEYNFPEFHVLSTRCTFFFDESVAKVYVVIQLSSMDFKLIFDESSLIKYSKQMKEILDPYGIADIGRN